MYLLQVVVVGRVTKASVFLGQRVNPILGTGVFKVPYSRRGLDRQKWFTVLHVFDGVS